MIKVVVRVMESDGWVVSFRVGVDYLTKQILASVHYRFVECVSVIFHLSLTCHPKENLKSFVDGGLTIGIGLSRGIRVI